MFWPHPIPRLRQFVLGVATILLAVLTFATRASAQANTYGSHTISGSYGQCITTDSNGNVYYAGTNSSTTTYTPDGVYEIMAVNGAVPATPTIRKLNIGTTVPECVAVDGQGNVFVMGGTTNIADTIYELVAVNGSVPDSPTIRTILSGASFYGYSLSADRAGDIFFVTEIGGFASASEYLQEMAAVNGTIPDNTLPVTLISRTEGGGPGTDFDLTIGNPKPDSNGNLFYFDDSNLKEFVAVNGTIPSNPTPQSIAINYDAGGPPATYVIDNKGNLFYTVLTINTDGSIGGVLKEILSVDGAIQNNSTPVTLYTTTAVNLDPRDIAVDSNGNAFVTHDRATVSQNIQELSPLAAGTVTIAPTTLTFPSTPVGSMSLSQDAVVTNGTAQAVYLAQGTLTDSIDFVATNDCGSIVPANGTCNVTFAFTPQTTGALTSTYSTYNLNTPTSPLTVALSGTGSTSTVYGSLTPADGTFGTIPAGAYNNVTFTLSATGSGSLSISSITLTGADASTFSIASDTCMTAHLASIPVRSLAAQTKGARLQPFAFPALPAGTSCNITVNFSPKTAGSFSAALTVVDSAGTQTAPLNGAATGTGATTSPQASLTPATVNFGSVTTGKSGTSQTFTLTNSGSAVLPISSVSITGTNASSFTINAATCGGSLNAGSACVIPVTFTPTTTGSLAATLSVIDSVGTQTSTLSGTGTSATAASDFTVSATPSTQSSYRGSTVTYSVLLNSASPTNPFTSAVALTATGLPAGASVSFSPASVVPGTSQPTTSTMTITIPQLSSQNRQPAAPGPSGGLPAGASLASLGFALFYRRRKQLPSLSLLLIVALAGITAALTGCSNSSTGFAIPTPTSTITVTGTSGSITHSTTVTLTVK